MLYDKTIVLETAESFRKRYSGKIDAAVILGSGLSDVLSGFDKKADFGFSDVRHLKTSTVPGHGNKFSVMEFRGKTVLAVQGRAHLYEGHSAFEASLPVAMIGELGAEILILTNAAGGINKEFHAGNIMAITDHINLQAQSPLSGIPDASKFVDLSDAWDNSLIGELKKNVPDLKSGIYAGVLGPNYETPAEIRYLRTIGADAVGMSTVMEAIMAKFYKMRLFGFSMITNMAAGIKGKLSHQEVTEVGRTSGAALLSAVKTVLLKS